MALWNRRKGGFFVLAHAGTMDGIGHHEIIRIVRENTQAKVKRMAEIATRPTSGKNLVLQPNLQPK
jgi:phage terminase large subunit-like protein